MLLRHAQHDRGVEPLAPSGAVRLRGRGGRLFAAVADHAAAGLLVIRERGRGWGTGRGRRSGSRRSLGGGGGRDLARRWGIADHGHVGLDCRRRALGQQDLLQEAGNGAGYLGIDLVGLDLDQRLISRDRIANLLEPATDRALGDRLAQLRHLDDRGHSSVLRKPPHRGDDVIDIGQDRFLELRGVRHVGIRRG